MNDKLIMEDYLLILKSTVEVYVHGTLESANNDVRMILKDGLNDTLNAQARVYDQMTSYGWYNVENVMSSEINKTLNKIEGSN